MLILELLDLAMQKCGNPLHVQVGNKEFMNSLILLLNQKGLPPQISNRTLGLIQKWGIQFERDSDILPLFSQVYQALKQKGVNFPDYVPDTAPQAQQSQPRNELPA